jgi:exopolysaccharide production protein ExoZ
LLLDAPIPQMAHCPSSGGLPDALPKNNLLTMRKLAGLQYLRAAAAIAVVLFHAGLKSDLQFPLGEAGVDLFFALSGFLMVAITHDGSRPGPFIRDRILRIVPIYWIATTVMLAGALLGAFPAVRLTLWHVTSSYAFIPSISPSNGETWPLLVPGWTLNYEMMFYAVFAGLLHLRSEVQRMVVLTVLFGTLVALGIAFRPENAIASTYTGQMLLEFAAGGWLGILWKRSGWPRWGWPLIAAAFFIVIVLSHTQSARVLTFGIPSLLLLGAVLIIERKHPIPEWRIPLFLGDASYSIYLWHTLAISVAAKVCDALNFPPALVFIACVGAGVTSGAVGYLLLERPILRFFKARRYKKGAPIPAGV